MSTVLDAALCLLLVSAAVYVSTAVPLDDPRTNGEVDREVGAVLATTTAAVEYQAGDVRSRDRGTLARLLATAAVANATIDGTQIAPAPGYVHSVSETVEQSVAGIESDVRVEVRAAWEPVPGGPVRGTVAVGPSPPPGVDVHATTLTVPVSSSGGDDPRPSHSDSFAGAATATARAATAVLFPPERTRPALRSDGDPRRAVLERYRSAARTLDVDLDSALADGNATAANSRVAAALAEEVEPSLRRQYDDPDEAASAVAPDEVTIVVRAWSG